MHNLLSFGMYVLPKPLLHIKITNILSIPSFLMSFALPSHISPISCNHTVLKSFMQGKLTFFFFFWDRCPGTHSIKQAGLQLKDPPASSSWVLRLKACATMPGSYVILLSGCFHLKLFFGSSMLLYASLTIPVLFLATARLLNDYFPICPSYWWAFGLFLIWSNEKLF